jgi:hypothetical protein
VPTINLNERPQGPRRHFERTVPISGEIDGQHFLAEVVICAGDIIRCDPILRPHLRDDKTVDGLCRVVKAMGWKLEVC